MQCADDAEEAAAVATRVADLVASGFAHRDIAILMRTNAASEPFEVAFAEANIPYIMRGAERFFDRPEVREAIVRMRGHAVAGGGRRKGSAAKAAQSDTTRAAVDAAEANGAAAATHGGPASAPSPSATSPVKSTASTPPSADLPFQAELGEAGPAPATRPAAERGRDQRPGRADPRRPGRDGLAVERSGQRGCHARALGVPGRGPRAG